MPKVISSEEMDHLAMLSRLELTEEEKEKFAQHINDILAYFQKLNELDTEGVGPTSHILPIKNVYREDISAESIDGDKMLSIAPDKEDGFFKVPRII